MENKNTIVAMVLMLAVWLGYSYLFPTAPPVTPATPVIDHQPAPTTAVEAPRVDTVAANPDAGAQPLVPTPAQSEQLLTVENERFRAVLTSSGGRLKSLELKDYRATPAADSGPVVLLPSGPARQGALRTVGQDGFSIAEDAHFQFEEALDQDLRLSGAQSHSLTLTHISANGLKFQKIYTFQGDSYGIKLQVVVGNHGAAALSGTTGLVMVSPWDESHKGSATEHVGPITFAGDKLHKDDVDDLVKESATYGETLLWSGFETKYFISILAPMAGAAEKVQISKTDSLVENLLLSPYFSLHPGESRASDFLVYYGPKDQEVLAGVNPELGKAIDFGFFSLLATPLLQVIKFIYGFVGNYGVAIILVTVIIKLLFWPLTQKSYTSMKAMQKLQPEMTKIRERCKNDREKLNREIMELYKKNRVNPMGGCLPMLVQIPVFFALYKVLMDTIDLRHAHFALWITDLSDKDPYYITPLIMGATMFIQQKMSPSTMDPVQAKVFMLMPVIFTFLFLNFPSGLVLYWLVNNLLTILQQYFINRKA